MSNPDTVIVYVQDRIGDIYCYSINKIEHRDAAVKHAQRWMRQKKFLDWQGRSLGVVKPLKLVTKYLEDGKET